MFVIVAVVVVGMIPLPTIIVRTLRRNEPDEAARARALLAGRMLPVIAATAVAQTLAVPLPSTRHPGTTRTWLL